MIIIELRQNRKKPNKGITTSSATQQKKKKSKMQKLDERLN